MYTALSHYWLAEIHYRHKDYNLALKELNAFEATPGSAMLSEYKRSLYNKGTYFSKEDYGGAATNFRLFLERSRQGADCLLMQSFAWRILTS